MSSNWNSKIPLLHSSRRLELRHGVKPITSRPHPIGKNCIVEGVALPSRPILVEAILIETMCPADDWLIEDVQVGYSTLRCIAGSRFLEYPIYGSSDGNKLPREGATVLAGQRFAIIARYIGPKPLGEVFIAALYGENFTGDAASVINTRNR